MRALVFLLAVAVAVSANPVWPSSYYVETNFLIPYWNISQPISMYYDGANNRGNLEYYDGLDGFVYLPNHNISYQTFVWKDHMACRQYTGDDVDPEVVSLLPDLSTWEYKGAGTYDGIDCDVYEHIEMNDGRKNTYTFYVRLDSSKNPVPIAYHMLGYDVVFGSHYDIYIIEYGLYLPDYAPEEKFAVPSICGVGSISPSKSTNKIHNIVKLALGGANVDAHARNLETIARHNTHGRKGFKMAPNHLTHLEYSDIKGMMMGVKATGEHPNAEMYVPTGESVPDSWDWREHNAVTAIKDQGACGSCWAFGTVGAIEGAYALKYNEQQMFSEQQIVDCAWSDSLSDNDNNGCEGGIQELALDWVKEHGALSYEWAYPYKMIDDWCRNDSIGADGVKITGHAVAPSGDEDAVKEALYKNGPMTISIDVTNDMVWYKDGVFNDPLCSGDYDQLDHAVLLVGYGTDAEQGDYWIVKNSWSTHWGDDGYIKIARNAGNMCGVATDAVWVPQDMITKL